MLYRLCIKPVFRLPLFTYILVSLRVLIPHTKPQRTQRIKAVIFCFIFLNFVFFVYSVSLRETRLSPFTPIFFLFQSTIGNHQSLFILLSCLVFWHLTYILVFLCALCVSAVNLAFCPGSVFAVNILLSFAFRL